MWLVGPLALGLALLTVGLVAGHPNHDGNGSVRRERLPWVDSQSLILTQGQFGCNPSHCVDNGLQYATDWDISGAPTFPIYAVAEGDATCTEDNAGGWGFRVLVQRTNSILHSSRRMAAARISSSGSGVATGVRLAIWLNPVKDLIACTSDWPANLTQSACIPRGPAITICRICMRSSSSVNDPVSICSSGDVFPLLQAPKSNRAQSANTVADRPITRPI